MRSIQNKLFLYLFSLALIPLIIIGMFSYTTYMKALREKLILNIELNMEQISKNIDWKVESIQKYMDLIITNKQIISTLSKENINFAIGGNYRTLMELDEFFHSFFYEDKNVKYAGLFSEKGGYFLYNSGVIKNELLVKKSKWYSEIVAGNGKIVWMGNVQEPNFLLSEKNYFIVGRRILNSIDEFGVMEPLGVFIISLKNEFFTDVFMDMDKISDAQAAIISIDGKVIMQKGNTNFRDYADYPFFQQIKNKNNGYLFTEINGHQVTAAYSTSKLTGWKIIKIFPRSYLVEEIQSISYLTLWILVASMVVFYFASFIISKGISKPIKGLAAAMKKVGKKDFEVSVPIFAQDEIGMISEGFNTMVKEIKDLFELTIKEEQLKRKAQIRAMQYQINPHFIYNTLSIIRLIANEVRDFKAADMLKTLIHLLRNTVSKADLYITVKEEICNIKDYIYLQKIQYENRLRVDYDIDDDILECMIPNMLLQPVVENSIIHGLNNKLNTEDVEAIIIIKGYQNENDLFFEIWDNGVGIDKETITNIFLGSSIRMIDKSDLHQESQAHIGINNIHDRIKYEFGAGYGIQIESVVGRYTLVKVHLPFVRKKEEQTC